MNEQTPVTHVLRTGEPLILSASDVPHPKDRFIETVDSQHLCHAYIPLTFPSRQPDSLYPTFGVLKVVNRRLEQSKTVSIGRFTWEDISLLELLAEIIGVVFFLVKGAQNMGDIVERTFHGIRSSLRASLQSLNQVVMYGSMDNWPPALQYNIPDTIAFLEMVDSQIDKLSASQPFGTPNIQPVALYGDILSKVVASANKLHRTFNVPGISITNLSEAGFGKLPLVRGDQTMLISVFRNILENALKYSWPNKECRIELGYSNDADSVIVSITDNGIGIDKEDQKWIFSEGYRSENAMRRNTMGTGIGLYLCRHYLQSMGGEIKVVSRPGRTCVSVKLLKWS